jgi:bacteriocin biosynthesis cyclodehydratase domain-containing protein
MSRQMPRPRPGRPLLRRARDQVQVGLDPAAAVVVSRLSDDASSALLRLDGGIGLHDLVAAHPELGPVLDSLHRRGLLDDDADRPTALPAFRRERWGAELGAHALTSSYPAATALLRRRSKAAVAVRGNDRCAAMVAVGLAAAGVGVVALEGPDTVVGPRDLTPSGPFEPQVPWLEHVAEAVRRQGASPAASSSRTRGPVAVVVCASADSDVPWTDPELADDLLSDGVPHLPVAVSGVQARVGPFVVPGVPGCLWCQEHRRRDADPAWPALADQLRLHHPRATTSLGVVASAAASLAVAQVLQVVDAGRDARPASLGAQLVVAAPDLLVERHDAPAHPVCGCGWAGYASTMVG